MACELPEIDSTEDAYEIFKTTEWGDMWDDANIQAVLYYLRGATDLVLGDWRALFPRTLYI